MKPYIERAADLLIEFNKRYLELADVEDCNEIRVLIAAALAEAEEETVRRCSNIVRRWQEAYPEDIFRPVPKYDEQTPEQAILITCASAQMGRHITARLLEQFDGILVGEAKVLAGFESEGS